MTRMMDLVGIGEPMPAFGNGEIPPPSPPAPKLNGCNNRPPKSKTVWVQDGWISYPIGGHQSRLPRMVEIPDPMSDDCHYDKAHTDRGCTGCVHKKEIAA